MPFRRGLIDIPQTYAFKLRPQLHAGAQVEAFDCIEFDPALRWIDVLADLAFTVMDFDKLRARRLRLSPAAPRPFCAVPSVTRREP